MYTSQTTWFGEFAADIYSHMHAYSYYTFCEYSDLKFIVAAICQHILRVSYYNTYVYKRSKKRSHNHNNCYLRKTVTSMQV